MITTNSNMVYIGNLPIIDNDESDWDTDNAAALAGTYTSFGGGLEQVTVTQNDQNNDGLIYDDEAGLSDTVSYTTSNGAYSGQVDASVSYDAVITEADGTIHNMEVMVLQMLNGDTFVNEVYQNGQFENLTIRSIELVSPVITNASGYATANSADGTTVCFGLGTQIETTTGISPIEDLMRGDLVLSRDRGPVPVLWAGRQVWSQGEAAPPVLIPPGALGKGVPFTALRVTAQHRVLVESQVSERVCRQSAVLVPAKSLVGTGGIRHLNGLRVFDCAHIYCGAHHLIRANGAWLETLHPGAWARMVGAPVSDLSFVRPVVAGHRKHNLIRRHKKNAVAFQKALI